ncbi:MAG: alpha/beta hydrolase [Promethearchaeota archaeon]
MNIDDDLISRVVFYPRKIRKPSQLTSNIKTLEFEVEPGVSLGGLCFINDKDLPTIFLFHGNGEIAADYQYFASSYFDCNVNLAVIDFRGYGFSSGKPYYSSLITDAYPVYIQFEKWIDENQMNDSIFVKGRSLGSTCAAEIGSHNPKRLKGIIFESGFGSLYKMMTGLFNIHHPDVTPELLSPISNDRRIKKIEKPTLILHGTSDFIIPSEQANIIHDSLPEKTYKKLILIQGAGHNDIAMYKDEYYPPIKNFIQEFK